MPDTLWQEDEEVLVEDDIDVGTGDPARIVVFNDEHNTFDWVVLCFMEVLGHTYIQSDQLALIIHNNGKATVKSGSKDELQPLKDGLVDRGLSAVLESA